VETGLATLESGYAGWKATGFENWRAWYGVLRSDLLLMLGRGRSAGRDGRAGASDKAQNSHQDRGHRQTTKIYRGPKRPASFENGNLMR
jgi:hypothetical protein